MSDIVEQARYTADNGIPDFTNAPLLRALADEIERLRFELSDAEAQLDKFGLVSPQQYEKDLAACCAEIERLREQVKYWNDIACEDRAEVERLRAIIRDGSGGYTARELEAEKLKSHEI